MNFAIILNIFFKLWNSFNEIAEINRLKAEAESAYIQGKFSVSAQKYRDMINSYNITDERVHLNLAHSYYSLHDSINAEFHYKKLSKSNQARINSTSNHQLGIIAATNKDYQTALKYFRLALKSDAGNEAARYNYELIKKKLEQEENKNPDKDKKKQNEKEQQKQGDNSEMMENDDSPSGGKATTGSHDDQGKRGESETSVQNNKGNQKKNKEEGEKNKASDASRHGDEQEEYNELKPDEKGNRKRNALISQRLKLMNMSEDKAKMILDAMKNSEIQYLQQMKKKGKTRYDKDKPDW